MKAKINLENIKGFLQGNTRKIFDEWFNLSQTHIKEQAVWRLERIKRISPECYIKDECSECGCQISSKVFESRGCSDNQKCYPSLYLKEDWEKAKPFLEVCERLMTDSELWNAYKSNIAMAFKDAHHNARQKKGKPLSDKEIRTIANEAAEEFLKNLTR